MATTRLKNVFDIESFIQEIPIMNKSLWTETLTPSLIFFFVQMNIRHLTNQVIYAIFNKAPYGLKSVKKKKKYHLLININSPIEQVHFKESTFPAQD